MFNYVPLCTKEYQFVLYFLEQDHRLHLKQTDAEDFNPKYLPQYDERYDEDLPDYPDSAYDSPTAGGGRTSILPAVIVNDEFTMIEGAAICMYLADLYGHFLPENQYKAEYYRCLHVYSVCQYRICMQHV